jgi:hypothetical protein
MIYTLYRVCPFVKPYFFRGPWDILYCSCQEGKLKKVIFYENSQLQKHSDFGNTLTLESQLQIRV